MKMNNCTIARPSCFRRWQRRAMSTVANAWESRTTFRSLRCRRNCWSTIFSIIGIHHDDEFEQREPTDQEAYFDAPLKILLAEDGMVNQQVAIGLLRPSVTN